jgi:DNA modification methylase
VFQTGAGPAVRISMKAARRQTSPIVQSADDRLGGQSVQKPVELLTSIVSNCTKRGDLVLEPYLRDGSTLIAAELTNRVCVGADEKPLSVDRAIRRWQRMTGKMAHNLIRDESFDELAQRVVNQGLDHVK